MKRKNVCLFTGFFLLAVLISPTKLLAAPYYEGKVLTIIVGSSVGGGYDQVARILAKHLPRYIPGKPRVIVENMVGAGSMIAANHVYSKSKPDGMTIVSVNRGILNAQLLKGEGVRFDFAKFSFIGSAASEAQVLCIRTDLPYKTFGDLQNASKKKQIFVGQSGGPGSINTQLVHLSNAYLGLNLKLIAYPGTPEVMLALEQKEVDGMWQAYNSAVRDIEKGVMRPLIRTWISQRGAEHLPVVDDLTTDPIGKKIFAMLGRPGLMTRIYLAPPGVPANVMEILRDAFAKVLKSPELQADAEKSKMELRYTSAEKCIEVTNFVLNQPPEVLKEFSKYVEY